MYIHIHIYIHIGDMSCKNTVIALFVVTYCVLPFSGAATRKNDDA